MLAIGNANQLYASERKVVFLNPQARGLWYMRAIILHGVSTANRITEYSGPVNSVVCAFVAVDPALQAGFNRPVHRAFITMAESPDWIDGIEDYTHKLGNVVAPLSIVVGQSCQPPDPDFVVTTEMRFNESRRAELHRSRWAAWHSRNGSEPPSAPTLHQWGAYARSIF